MAIELPDETFLRPMPGVEDTFSFRYDFVLAGKALEDGGSEPTVTEDENGDLIIEGYAAVFEGVDRQGENFAEGAFNRGIKSFLGGQSGLCYHHKHDKLLGKVLELDPDENGLRMKARVDGAIKNHPELGTYYAQIKNGSLNALSVGGFFKRDTTRKKIVDMDFTEISVTPVPVHSGTSFAVVAGKALASEIPTPKDADIEDAAEVRDEDIQSLNWIVDEYNRLLDRIEENVNKRKGDSD